MSSQAADAAGSQIVWFTGAADLRVADHGGLLVAASTAAERGAAVVPIFIFDPEVHFMYPPSRMALLHAALTSLEQELFERWEVPLILRSGDPAALLPALADECGASAVHTIAADVEMPMRRAQRRACDALESAGVGVQHWSAVLRTAVWEREGGLGIGGLPGDFPTYVEAVRSVPLQAPLDLPDEVPFLLDSLETSPVPPLDELLAKLHASTTTSA